MHLKIWHKIIIGISIPSLIAILGGLLSYGYINSTERRLEYQEISDDIRDQVLELRWNEKNFLQYKNAEYLEHVTNALLILNNSIKHITVDEIGRKDSLLLQDSVGKYPKFIDDLYLNYQQENAVVQKARSEGRKLETNVKKVQYGETLSISFILHLRLLEKNYLLFRDRKSYLKLKDGLLKLKNAPPLCHECRLYIKTIRDLFAINQKNDSLVNKLKFEGDRLEEITGRIALRERERIRLFLTKMKYSLLAVLLLLCTLGPVLVYKTATYIAEPIKRLAQITRKISEGYLDLRAPIKEHDETYDLANSFNLMLDHLQLTHKSLEKSMRLLKEKQVQLVDSEKRASLGLLVSGVAHELNNPLNNISLTVEALDEVLEDLSNKEVREYIHDILKERERAQHIVENLLDFARARRSTNMGKQNIILIVKEAFSLIASQLRINKIELQQNIPDTPFFIKGNRSKLEQILVSIYTNAIQSMKEGGTLTVSLRPDAKNNNVLIKINDTGPGIAKENIKNIFDPFFTTKPTGEGTGLGLSVCHSLVKEHKGEIEVESKPGEGTTFTVKLPLYEDNEQS